MPYRKFISAAILLIGVSVAFNSAAQDTTPPTATQEQSGTPATDLAIGEPLVDGVAVGTAYNRESFGDWEMRCILSADGKDPCQLYQVMNNREGNPMAEISLFELPPDQPAVAGATIATPLETLLTRQLTISVDGRNSKRYPFSYCSVNGCYARVGLTPDDIAAFKRGVVATVTIVRVAAPGRVVELRMSLAGFTKGFAAVLASNAANRAE